MCCCRSGIRVVVWSVFCRITGNEWFLSATVSIVGALHFAKFMNFIQLHGDVVYLTMRVISSECEIVLVYAVGRFSAVSSSRGTLVPPHKHMAGWATYRGYSVVHWLQM